MEVVLVLGYPAAGKSSLADARYGATGHVRLNRDAVGGRLADLLPRLEAALTGEGPGVVMDNTYPTVESRRPVLEVARRHGAPVRCVHLATTIEDAQYNVVARMLARHGRYLSPEELAAAAKTDPGLFPPAVLFKYRKQFEKPTAAEGFAAIETVPFVRRPHAGHAGKALLLDYDGTLRRTRSGEKYPRTPDDVELLPGRRAVLERHARDGYRLLGVSNQGDVARGKLSAADARACFERTNELLGLEIEYAFCPHDPVPVGCYCRKPMPGLGVDFVVRHQLDPAQTIMVGDRTTDRTFAERVGVRYVDQGAFFA